MAIALLTLLGLVMVYPRAEEFVLVDRCLDAGGAWDEAREKCRFSDSKND